MKCKVLGCDREKTKRGMCNLHYKRFVRHGNTDLIERTTPLEVRFWKKVNKIDVNKCWEWKASKQNGYGHFYPSEGTSITAHRMSWILTHGEIPEGLLVLHKCDNPPCVNPNHLFIGTQQDNMDDKVNKGRSSKGSENPVSKLTEIEVTEIRKIYSMGGITQKELGKKYGVYQTVISKIILRKIWTHI